MQIVLARDEVFHRAGEPVDQVVFVRSGALRLVTRGNRRGRQVVAFKYPGECLVPPVGRRHVFDIEAIDITELKVLPLDAFEEALGNDGKALARLHGMLHAELVATYERMAVIGRRDSRAAVASFLLDMADRVLPREEGGWFPVLTPRSDIADHLGLRPETVSRVLTQFLGDSLVERANGRRLRLKDRARLSLVVSGRA